MTKDQLYINRCIQLAKLGKGSTQLNPMVGAILVHDNEIIGEGYHKQYGLAHAEIHCLESVAEKNRNRISQATLYVSLEPCNHHGKTPPCSQAIVHASIPKVVIGCTDPNPLVDNTGIQYLKENGVEVEVGINERECAELNKVFFTNQQKKRCYVKLKWAQSKNGIIGDHSNRIKISSPESNLINHKYRAAIDGILVGYHTAITDKPLLNLRHWIGQEAARVFIDKELRIPIEIVSKKGSRNIVLNTKCTKKEGDVEYYKIELSALEITKKLLNLGLASVLIEGGAKTHQLFIDENNWDEAIVIESTKHQEGKIKAAILKNEVKQNTIKTGTDLVHHYRNKSF